MSTMEAGRLGEVAIGALERSAFVFAEPAAPGDLAVLPPRAVFSRIKVTGSVCGELYLAASDGFACELASSLLGVEPHEVAAGVQGADALREMANMIAGSVILEYDGENQAYRLGLPENGDKAGYEAAARSGVSTTLVTNGEPITVIWRQAEAKACAA